MGFKLHAQSQPRAQLCAPPFLLISLAILVKYHDASAPCCACIRAVHVVTSSPTETCGVTEHEQHCDVHHSPARAAKCKCRSVALTTAHRPGIE